MQIINPKSYQQNRYSLRIDLINKKQTARSIVVIRQRQAIEKQILPSNIKELNIYRIIGIRL